MKRRVYEILTDPPEGDWFGNTISVSILILIAFNVFIGILETVPSLGKKYPNFFYQFELFSVIVFSIEYVLRIWSCTSSPKFKEPIRGRLRQMAAPMAIVDILAILPFYIELLFPSGVDLRFIRVLRLFRLFRVFRVGKLADSFRTLGKVLFGKREQLLISLVIVVIVTILSANVMYIIEHEKNENFSSVPAALWWAIITITTIGYGDTFPITPLGKIFGGMIGFLGICVFALPVGIIGAGFVQEVDSNKEEEEEQQQQKECPHCGKNIHEEKGII